MCDRAGESCVAHALGNFCQTFLLSYGIRVRIGILLCIHAGASLLDLKDKKMLVAFAILLQIDLSQPPSSNPFISFLIDKLFRFDFPLRIGSGDRDNVITGLPHNLLLEGLDPQWMRPPLPRLPILDGEFIWLNTDGNHELLWDYGMCADTSRGATVRDSIANALTGQLASAQQEACAAYYDYHFSSHSLSMLLLLIMQAIQYNGILYSESTYVCNLQMCKG